MHTVCNIYSLLLSRSTAEGSVKSTCDDRSLYTSPCSRSGRKFKMFWSTISDWDTAVYMTTSPLALFHWCYTLHYISHKTKKLNTFHRSLFKTILNSNIIVIKSSSSISSSRSIYVYQLKLYHQNKTPCGSVATKNESITILLSVTDPFHIFGFLKSRWCHSWVISIHPFLGVKMCVAICKFYGSSFRSHPRPAIFICLLLKMCVSYDIILMCYLNYEHTGL